jgi:PAS domain S-box-containing protein
MADHLYAAGGIPVGILDVNGEILVGAGWQTICTNFHRAHPVTCEKCHISDAYIISRLNSKEPVQYKCQNGMWDIAVPILVGGEHLATLFVGQFFYDDERVDESFFVRQAETYGFDKTSYLEALKKVPIFSRERVTHMMTYYQDLVQTLAENGRWRMEQESMTRMLRDRESQLHSIVTHSPNAVYRCLLDADRPIVFMSDAIRLISGYPASDFIQNHVRSLPDIIHPDDRCRVEHAVESSVASGTSYVVVYRINTAKGTVRWVQENGRSIRVEETGEWVLDGSIQDITERRDAEETLRVSLHEKEVLLREIHHRVKNNLQIISSLVNLQSNRTEDESARGIFRDIRDRVHSMALVHENLYRSDNLSRINFANYIRTLVNELGRAYASSCAIRLTMDLEPLSLSVDTAIPCGLVVNELVTNAYKHAFRNRPEGEISLSLHQASDDTIILTVRDNGTGMPPGMDWKQHPSLGLQLAQMLSKQINGKLHLGTTQGTEFILTFQPNRSNS